MNSQKFTKYRRRQQQESCYRKRKFPNVSLAAKEALRLNRKIGKNQVEAYFCHVCQQYHVGGISKVILKIAEMNRI